MRVSSGDFGLLDPRLEDITLRLGVRDLQLGLLDKPAFVFLDRSDRGPLSGRLLLTRLHHRDDVGVERFVPLGVDLDAELALDGRRDHGIDLRCHKVCRNLQRYRLGFNEVTKDGRQERGRVGRAGARRQGGHWGPFRRSS